MKTDNEGTTARRTLDELLNEIVKTTIQTLHEVLTGIRSATKYTMFDRKAKKIVDFPKGLTKIRSLLDGYTNACRVNKMNSFSLFLYRRGNRTIVGTGTNIRSDAK